MSNTTTVIPFQYHSTQFRTITDEHGEPWFVAKDVCEILEMKTEQVRRLDDDEKGLRKTQTLGGEQEMVVISESGLYTLIIRSNKPEARAFRKWVTSEVLPAIRRTGSYALHQSTQELGEHCRQVNKALATPGLDYQTRWSIASRLCKAIFGEDAAYMLGEREVRALRSELDGHTRADRSGVASVLVLTDQGIQLAPALRMMFVEECCTIKPGLAAPESALYAVFERWWQWSFGFDAPPLDLFRVMITGRIRRFALGGEPWYLGIEPQEACPWLLSKKPGRLPGPDSLDGEVRP